MTLFTPKDRANLHEALDMLINAVDARADELTLPSEVVIQLALKDQVLLENGEYAPASVEEDTCMMRYVTETEGANWLPDWK